MKSRNKFTHNDIRQAIFFGHGPKYVCMPFLTLPGPHLLEKLEVEFEIVTFEGKSNPFDILGRCLVRVGRRKVTSSEDIRRLHLFLIRGLMGAYREAVESWITYLDSEFEKFVKTDSYSHIQWKLISTLGVESVLKTMIPSYEQKLWIVLHQGEDEITQVKTMIDIRDSLLPWINPQLWVSTEKKKSNTHVNAKYEEHHKILESGKSLEELDIVS